MEKESWETKLGATETEARNLAASEKDLKSSLKGAMCSNKELEDKVSDLKDDMV